MKKLFERIQTRHLLAIFMLMFVLDKIHCIYLATKYCCDISELYYTVGFFWLSTVFGIVDLILGGMILIKNNSAVRSTPKLKAYTLVLPIINHTYTLTCQVNVTWLTRKIYNLIRTFICFISISSLLWDLMRFFSNL